jgi:hypothetical protein
VSILIGGSGGVASVLEKCYAESMNYGSLAKKLYPCYSDFMENVPQPKKEALQVIAETGLAQDYRNTFTAITSAAENSEIFSLIIGSGWVPKTYSEYLVSNQFPEGNNEQTREAITQIDALAEALRSKIETDQIVTPEEIKEYAHAMDRMIYGK